MEIIYTHTYGGATRNVTVLDPELSPGTVEGCSAYGVWISAEGYPTDQYLSVDFQEGAVREVGPNGIRNEDLLAIVAHRLKRFQSGPCACEENKKALENIESALSWLNKRTEDRTKRGVEGTYKA